MLAFISYTSFFMNRNDGTPARTAVVMTTLLAQITLRIVVSQKIPISRERTWLETFQGLLMFFNFTAVVVWVFILWLIQCKYKRHRWEPAATHDWDPPKFLKTTRHLYEDILDDIAVEKGKRTKALFQRVLNSWRVNVVRHWGVEGIGPHARFEGCTLPKLLSDDPKDEYQSPMSFFTSGSAAPWAGTFLDRHVPGQQFQDKPSDDHARTVVRSANRALSGRIAIEAMLNVKSTAVRECLEDAKLQKRIKERRHTYTLLPDGPGPVLAKKIDLCMRVIYPTFLLYGFLWNSFKLDLFHPYF